MFVSIGGQKGRGEEGGPLLLLEGCHGRIRASTILALRLTDPTLAAPAGQICEAADAVCRYFREALPKHVADEEQSLGPRLPAASSKAALSEMASQHRALEAVLERLVGLWHQLAGSPAELPRLAPILRTPTSELASLWEPHLALEERELFPLLDRLGPEEKAAMWREMRSRRRPV